MKVGHGTSQGSDSDLKITELQTADKTDIR